MAIYIGKSNVSGYSTASSNGYTVDFNVLMTEGTGLDLTIGVSVTTFKAGFWVTENVLGNNSWGSTGIFEVELELDVVNINVAARCRPVRIAIDGSITEGGQWSDWQLCDVSRVFDGGLTNPPDSPASGWTDGQKNDLVGIEWEFEKAGGAGAQAITIGTGTTANEVDSPVSEITPRNRFF